MGDFKFMNYCTEYSVKGSVNKGMNVEACFSRVFEGPAYMENEYVIRVYPGLVMANRSRDNNCFLSHKELHHHISLLKKIWNFTFYIKDKVTKDLISYFEINMSVKGPNLVHRFILTWLRYSYEFPYNLYILDVYRMKTCDHFKYVNPFTLFNIVSSYCGLGTDIHMLVCPGQHYKTMRITWLKNRITKLYKKHHNYVGAIYDNIEDVANYPIHDINTYNDWDLEYDERLVHYIEIYNKIHKL